MSRRRNLTRDHWVYKMLFFSSQLIGNLSMNSQKKHKNVGLLPSENLVCRKKLKTIRNKK